MIRIYDHEVKIKQEPVTIGLVASAVIGAGSAAYQADQQKKAGQKDIDAREAAAKVEQDRLDKISRDTRPEEEGAGAIEFGTGDDTTSGGFNQFIAAPKSSSFGGSSGRSGLGFSL